MGWQFPTGKPRDEEAKLPLGQRITVLGIVALSFAFLLPIPWLLQDARGDVRAGRALARGTICESAASVSCLSTEPGTLLYSNRERRAAGIVWTFESGLTRATSRIYLSTEDSQGLQSSARTTGYFFKDDLVALELPGGGFVVGSHTGSRGAWMSGFWCLPIGWLGLGGWFRAFQSRRRGLGWNEPMSLINHEFRQPPNSILLMMLIPGPAMLMYGASVGTTLKVAATLAVVVAAWPRLKELTASLLTRFGTAGKHEKL